VAAFLRTAGLRKWKVALAATVKDLLRMVSDLHERGEFIIHVNPNVDGTGGDQVMLPEILEFCERTP
jgi:hypothetical protein